MQPGLLFLDAGPFEYRCVFSKYFTDLVSRGLIARRAILNKDKRTNCANLKREVPRYTVNSRQDGKYILTIVCSFWFAGICSLKLFIHFVVFIKGIR
jgi:hypothetical protein